MSTKISILHDCNYKGYQVFQRRKSKISKRGKSPGGVDFFLAPTRCGSLQVPCGRPVQHRWSVAGRAEAVASEAAGGECRAAPGDRTPERAERPTVDQTQWDGERHLAKARWKRGPSPQARQGRAAGQGRGADPQSGG